MMKACKQLGRMERGRGDCQICKTPTTIRLQHWYARKMQNIGYNKIAALCKPGGPHYAFVSLQKKGK
jgi:hypothetical protein